MALDYHFTSDIENMVIATLYNSLSTMESVNVEYCRGAIVQARSVVMAVGGNWQLVQDKISLGIEEELLQILIEHKLLTLDK